MLKCVPGAHRANSVLVAVVIFGATHPAPTVLAAPADDSALSRIEALNPHLIDGEIPNLSLKVRSLSRGPYDFFRGTADLYYVWCKSNCADWLAAKDTSVMLHGDVHPGNTGTYVATPDGGPRLAYSLVDFDEAFEGPFQLDMLRAATSLRFAAAENGLTLSKDEWQRVVDTLVVAYRDVWKGVAATDVENREAAILWGDLRFGQIAIVKRLLTKAQGEDAIEYLDKYTKGTPPTRFKARRGKKKSPKDVMLPVSTTEREAIVAAMKGAMQTNGPLAGIDAKVLDVARWIRTGSSGSQGVRKYLVLLESPEDPLSRPSIFQLKEEPIPAAIRAGIDTPDATGDRAEKVAAAYGLLQRRPRRYVGWTRIGDGQFLIKPKDAFGKEPETEDMASAEALTDMARLMGTLLGMGHAKSCGSKDVTALKAAIDDAELTTQLDERSAHCFEAFSREYNAFRRDARAKTMADKAEQWLVEMASR